jgi:hypothetical protein
MTKTIKDESKVNFNIPLKIEHYEFIKRQFGIDFALSHSIIKEMPSIELKQFIDQRLNATIYSLKTSIFVDRHIKSKHITFKQPATWWDHFKVDYQRKYTLSESRFFRWLFRLWLKIFIRKSIQWKEDTTEIKFIKDFFPDKPAWHKKVFYESEKGEQLNFYIHEEMEII